MSVRRGRVRRARNGGFGARRAVVRWAWRLFRREWRQQVLVLLLLAGAVAAAVVAMSGGHHLAQPPQARFGTAQQLLRFDRSGPVTPEAGVAGRGNGSAPST